MARKRMGMKRRAAKIAGSKHGGSRTMLQSPYHHVLADIHKRGGKKR